MDKFEMFRKLPKRDTDIKAVGQMALIDLLSARWPQTCNLYLKRNEVAVRQNKGEHTEVTPASVLPHL